MQSSCIFNWTSKRADADAHGPCEETSTGMYSALNRMLYGSYTYIYC
jgi:hypothetical protein